MYVAYRCKTSESRQLVVIPSRNGKSILFSVPQIGDSLTDHAVLLDRVSASALCAQLTAWLEGESPESLPAE